MAILISVQKKNEIINFFKEKKQKVFWKYYYEN